MSNLHLFEAFGIELEYMIVDRQSLEVRPIADQLLQSMTGSFNGDFENGMVTWSNELVLHVIELKCTKPEYDLDQLEESFRRNVRQINDRLLQWNAMLLPTAAHPFMNPATDTRLWPHDNNEIYSIYNKIFNCKGHGWSNLQSTHLNLPFHGDEEFRRLHSAIRILLPLLPALCASSGVIDGKRTECIDQRMWYYKHNQQALPSITGKIVPEPVQSAKEYESVIYRTIAAEIGPHDPENILDPVWVNSRGAMARFDRGSIEIRVMDIQESPAIDMAIQSFVINALRGLVNEQIAYFPEQKSFDTDRLAAILDGTMRTGIDFPITDSEYLALFGMKAPSTAGEVLENIYGRLVAGEYPGFLRWRRNVELILLEGNLSTRIRRSMGTDFSRQKIADVWSKLADCLQNNSTYRS